MKIKLIQNSGNLEFGFAFFLKGRVRIRIIKMHIHNADKVQIIYLRIYIF